MKTNEATTRQLKAIHAPTEAMTTHTIKNKSTRKCRYCVMDDKAGQCPAKGKT